MTIWFTSDTHWCHNNIIKYDNRPFKTIKEHDETLIKNWNSKVKPNDTIYHLGDMFICGKGLMFKILDQLNGKIHLIRGNHDGYICRNQDLRARFESISDIKEININGQPITLCHYAMRTWNKSHWGAWMLYGHCHGKLPRETGRFSFDMGCMLWNYEPVSFEEVREEMKKIEKEKGRKGL